MGDTARRCSKCGEDKPLEAFSLHSYSKDGIRAYCKLCAKSYMKKWLEENPGRLAKLSKSWKENNPDRHRGNRPHHKAVAKRWRENNRDSIKAKSRKRKQNIDLINEIAPGQWDALVKIYGGKCLFPGCHEKSVTQDHVIPVSKGGRHHVSNLQPLCNAHNASKGTKDTDYRAFVISG